MGKARKIVAIGTCGLVLGGIMSTFGASTATGRAYSTCDQRAVKIEKQAARDFAKGKLSQADYDKVMQEVALHKELWGC